MKNKILKIFILTLFIVLLSAFVSAQTINYLEWSDTTEQTKVIDAGENANLYFLSSGVFTFDYPINVYLKIYSTDYSNYLTYNSIVLNNAEFDSAVDGNIDLNYLNLNPGFYNIRLISLDSFGNTGPEEYLYLNVKPTTPVNNPPVFTGIIADQTINNGENFVDIDLNDYFSDVDNDQLTFSTDATLFNITINNGIVNINYNFNFGFLETITFTACDTSNACVNSNPIDLTILYVPPSNVLNLNNINDVSLDINDNENIDLYSLTTYTDVSGNILDATTLNYSIINSTCINTNVNINNTTGILSVSSTANEEVCSFKVYVEETIYPGNMQFTTSNIVNVIVTDNTPANNPPVFTGIIADQTINNDDVFVDVDLNDYFSDVDNDQLVFSSDATLFDIDFVGGVAGVGYFGVGSELVTFTACDTSNACVDSNPVNLTVLPIPYSNFTLQELDCQYDVIPRNELQICHAVFHDQNNVPVENAEVTFYYTSPAALEVGTCMTNDQGYCNINFNAPNTIGTYNVFVSAYKIGFNTFVDTNTITSFEVVDAQYELTEFYIYDNPNYFNGNPQHDQIVFYRGDDVYVEFKVYDLFNQVYVNDPNLFTDVTLYGNSQIQQISFDFHGFNNDYYQFSLNNIPLDDDFLGEDLIISYALNGNAAGQEHRTINVLNNLPVWQQLNDIELTQDEQILIQIDNKVTDLEDTNLLINVESVPSFIDYDYFNGVLSFSGVSVGEGSIVLSAEDSDNGVAFTSFNIKINPQSGNHTLVAYFDAPSVAKPNAEVKFDASNSIGQILQYCWEFDDELGVCTANPIIYHSFDRGTYAIKLIVNDIYGNSDSYTKNINIKQGTSCADGVDNDGDGLIDMDDPGCQESDGFSEFNLNTDLEKGLKFEYADVYSNNFYTYPGDEITVNVMVSNKADQDADDLRVIVMSPDLGLKLKSELFDLDEGDSENFRMSFEIPYGTYAGEYPVKITVRNDDIIHSTYRFIYIY